VGLLDTHRKHEHNNVSYQNNKKRLRFRRYGMLYKEIAREQRERKSNNMCLPSTVGKYPQDTNTTSKTSYPSQLITKKISRVQDIRTVEIKIITS